LLSPFGVAVDTSGTLYIADTFNNRIRKVVNGIITTVAGDGNQGFGGDNGPAVRAQLCQPGGIALDSASNLYIADTCNNRVRKVSGGIIATVAGGGPSSVVEDNGQATSAQLSGPASIALDALGNLYIADTYNNCIRKVSNGVIATIAGTGEQAFGCVPPAVFASPLDHPFGIAVDSFGQVYFADGANRVRVLVPSDTAGPPPPSITTVVNAASNLTGSIAPGEIVVLTGTGLGPAQLMSASIAGDGLFDAQLAGTYVSFNGQLAPIIYTSATQVAAIVPYEVGGSSASVSVTYLGLTSAPISVPISSVSPGIFTLDSTGRGQAAVVNQNGSINGSAAPAKPGDIVLLFATGEGHTTPPEINGKPSIEPLPRPILAVTVRVGGQVVQPQYAGSAPGEVAGLLQVNLQIPVGLASGGSVPLELVVGGVASQPGITIAIGP
jgi:uncharacterized protein (TIGR03437 family)